MKPYYYVYRYGSNPPQIRHITLRAARNEAMRLAEQHPGAHFEILKFVGFSSSVSDLSLGGCLHCIGPCGHQSCVI